MGEGEEQEMMELLANLEFGRMAHHERQQKRS